MEPLVTQFTEGRFSYAQIERQGPIAIYRQRHIPSGKGERYEVVRIRVMKEHTWPNGDITPEHEVYPGATRWGQEGFTYFTEGDARAKMTHWLAAIRHLQRVHAEESP